MDEDITNNKTTEIDDTSDSSITKPIIDKKLQETQIIEEKIVLTHHRHSKQIKQRLKINRGSKHNQKDDENTDKSDDENDDNINKIEQNDEIKRSSDIIQHNNITELVKESNETIKLMMIL